jgi:thiamine biosynthesis lipoprotein
MTSYDDVGFAMGTVVNQTIYSTDKNIAAEIVDLLTTIEKQRISWREEDSEVAAINRNALAVRGGAPTEISQETKGYLQTALEIAADSNGAFDPTMGQLTQLWDFDGGSEVVPDASRISSLLADVGYAHVHVEGDSATLAESSSIDLGAMGKGIGCDEVESYFDAKGDVAGALVNIGGSSVLTYGKKSTDEPWKVAVLNPRDEVDYLGALTLKGTNHVSSSGDYERYFELDGKRYHHILDPATGYPVDNGLMSVTVVGRHGAQCDALSTACFVLGWEQSLELLARYDAEAIFVTTDKQVQVTDGLKDSFQLLADGYTVL